MRPPKRIKTEGCEIPVPNIEFLAKTNKSLKGIERGVSVFTHCLIVGLVARELIKRQPDWLKKALYPIGSECIAAAHDIGKISPGFQEKIYGNLKEKLGLVSVELDRGVGGHAAVSEAALQGMGTFLSEIAGRHHGASPIRKGFPDDGKYGGRVWQAERIKVLAALKRELQSDWPEISSENIADVVSGLTTVSDWIGSGRLFNNTEGKTNPTVEYLCEKINQALDDSGFLRLQVQKGLSFSEIFSSFSLRPIQQQLIDAVKKPGVYVLEAPMGVGKTEAALFAAYRAISENQATGIYFALPTQLTSNKMVDRMNRFLESILENTCTQRRSLLLHGNAWLKSTIGEEGEPGKSWFDNRKRGLLSPFAVGTIDQALMAVMNVKHGFVRTFGLAGKVVILDEVHSYDSYTGTIIDQLITVLRKIQCTVIILSATLTTDRRSAILSVPASDPLSKNIMSDYPLVSSLPNGKTIELFSTKIDEKSFVNINVCQEDKTAINEVLLRAENGQQVLWLENTVGDAQEYFKILGAKSAGLGIDCGLLHSRFLKTDREKNENRWVDIFGSEGRRQRNKKGRILVGTQVLEQSLDIDGDFLVTRICPTDMILQRIGRLWRHRENDAVRPGNAKRETWILSPSLEEAVININKFCKSAYVYAPYVLCRSLEVWENISKISLPGQIRELIEATYIERAEKDNWAHYKNKLEKKRYELRRLARVGLTKEGKTLPENKASTRYAESENVEVLLLRNKQSVGDKIFLRLLDDTTIIIEKEIQFRNNIKWRAIATLLQKNTVTVPERIAPTFYPHELKFLKDYVYLGNDEEFPFRAGIVKNSGEIIGLGQQNPLNGYFLRYDPMLGYLARKSNT